MPVTEKDLQAFHHFAQKKLRDEGAGSLYELVDSWEIQHATAGEHAENVAAVQGAIQDMQNGNAGRAAEEIPKELRAELNLPG